MAAGLTDAGAELSLAGLLAGTLYVTLHTAAAADDTELFGNGYARVAISDWTIVGARAHNTSSIDFPEATGAWGDPTHYAIYDAEDNGSILVSGPLANDIAAPGTGAQLSFLTDTLVFDLTTI